MVRHEFGIGPSKDAKMIRKAVFCDEQGYQNEFDESDPSSVSIVLYLDEQPIATGRLVKIDPSLYQLGRLAVLKEYRCKKVGHYTVNFLLAKAREMGANRVMAHVQDDKIGFYRKLGFKNMPGIEPDFDEGHRHVYMIRYL